MPSTLLAGPRARRAAMPSQIPPMMATAVSHLPHPAEHYSIEWKWDGVRAAGFWDGKQFRLQSRNLLDISVSYPELQPLGKSLGKRRAILDGEIVALDKHGRPSFATLQQRMHVKDVSVAKALAKRQPVLLVLFDLLYLNDRLLTGETYSERRELLQELSLAGPYWQVTGAHVGEGQAMLEAAQEQRLEGVVAKCLDSIYEPGRRSKSWLKIKVVGRQEFVVGGWIPERSGQDRRIGSMLIGYYDSDGSLHYAGKIGTGLRGPDHEMVLRRFGKPISRSPFKDLSRMAQARFVEPSLVIEVEYRRWPEQGMVQQGAYKGIREDKRPRSVVREQGS